MKKLLKCKRIILPLIALMIISLSTFIVFNFNTAIVQVKVLARKIYLASVDISGMEISSLLIDVTNGNTQYPTQYEWNAVEEDETRNIIYQINYKNNDSNKSYNAGDLELKVPNLLYELEGATSTYFNKYFHNLDISADNINSSVKEHEWSYQYSNDSKYIILTNNNKIELHSNFEGSLQISYFFVAIDIYKEVNKNIVTTLNNSLTSNELNIKCTTNKKTYTLSASNGKIKSIDGFPQGNYIWIKSSISVDKDKGVRYLHSSSNEINHPIMYVNAPEDAIILDEDLVELKKNESGKSYFYIRHGHMCGNVDTVFTSLLCVGIGDQTIYIGVPREKYFDNTIEYSLSLEGIYTKSNINQTIDHDHLGYEKVADITKTAKVSDFVFNYTGNLYSIDKVNQKVNIEIDDVKNDLFYTYFNIKGYSMYIGTKYDFKIGDDIMLYNSSQGLRRLQDNEYHFDTITFPVGNHYNSISGNNIYKSPCFINGNNKPIQNEKYDVDLYVRYANTNDYVLYQSFKNTNITFTNFPQKVVGYYFYIHDLTESVYYNNPQKIVFNIPNAENEASITNFDYLEIYHEDKTTPVNIPDDNSYASSLGKDIIKSFDNSTYGRNVQRGVATNYIDNVRTLITDYVEIKNFENINDDKYISTATAKMILGDWPNKRYNLGKNYTGYEVYTLLSEGLDYDDSREITMNESSRSDQIVKDAKKADGTKYTTTEYYNLVKNHVTHQIIRNWKNTNQTMIITIVNLSDTPIDFRDGREKNEYFYSQIESFTYPLFISKDSLIEHGSTVKINSSVKPYGSKYVSLDDETLYMLHFDTNDINSDGDVTEQLWGTIESNTIITSSSSNQDLITFVKTNMSNYDSNSAYVSLNDNYSYKLRTRNNNNKITNLVIYDSIENYVKQNGEYVLARESNNQYKGIFQGVNTSYAESQGYNVRVYYSENEKPGSLGTDTSWKVYTSSTDNSKVKSLAFEYLNSSNEKAVIPENSLTYVEVLMKSPSTISNNIMSTYNGSWVEWNALDTNGQIIADVVGINSNIVRVSLPSTLTVHHYEEGTTKKIAPDETKEVYLGNTYSTSSLINIPEEYAYENHHEGDDPSGTVNKEKYEITYYYKKLLPEITGNITKTGTNTIDNRTNTISYSIDYSGTLINYKGTSTLTIVDYLPYEIDLTKSSLDGGTYDNSTKTITWIHNNTSTSMSLKNINYTHNINVVYKNIPITVRNLDNRVISSYKIDNFDALEKESTITTQVNEKYKLIVNHLDIATNTPLTAQEERYLYGGEHYETSESNNLPNNYLLTAIPTNAEGNIESEETVVNYYYRKRVAVVNKNISKNTISEIDNRTKPVDYTISYYGDIKEYIGTSTITIVDYLPYEIDTTKSTLDGGVYDNNHKTITWIHELVTNTPDKTDFEFSHNINIVYKNIPVTIRKITNRLTGVFTIEDVNTGLIETTATTNINEKFKLIIEHIDVDTNLPLVQREERVVYGGDSYQTSELTELPNNYSLSARPLNYVGTIKSEETIVTYLYKKENPILTSKISRTGPEKITKKDEIINYTIEYEPEITNYIGLANTKVVSNLPYEIDLDKSELDGGVYDATKRTITWTDSFDVQSKTKMSKKFNYNIKISYLGVSLGDDIINQINGTTTIDGLTDSKEDSIITKCEVKGKIIVKYIDDLTGEEIIEQIESNDIIPSEYIPQSIDIKNYDLVSIPDNNIYHYQEEDQIIYYRYKRIKKEVKKEEIITNPETGVFSILPLTILIIVVGYILYVLINKKTLFKKM